MYGTSHEGKNVREFLAAAAAAIAVPIVFTGVAEGNGYTQNPHSRSSNCASGVVTNADRFSASLRASKGFPRAAPPTASCALQGSPSSPSSTIRAGERGRQRP
jgi:hypothetical protein